jgi:hypothetical protein
MLEERRRNLFWTPCAIYCINQVLEDFLKIRCVEECMEKGQKITKLIYNQIWLLNLMKSEFTHGNELLKPAGTQCVFQTNGCHPGSPVQARGKRCKKLF